MRAAREGAGLTQATLGVLVGGFTQKQVSVWEAGKADMGVDTLEIIAQVLDTSMGWLLEGKGKPPSGKVIPRRTKPLKPLRHG